MIYIYSVTLFYRNELCRASGVVEELIHWLRLNVKEIDRPSTSSMNQAKNQYGTSDGHHGQQPRQQHLIDLSSLVIQTKGELDRWHQVLVGSGGPSSLTTAVTTSSSSTASMDNTYPRPTLQYQSSSSSSSSQHQQNPTGTSQQSSTYQQQQQGSSSRSYNATTLMDQSHRQQTHHHLVRPTTDVDSIFDQFAPNVMNYRGSRNL